MRRASGYRKSATRLLTMFYCVVLASAAAVPVAFAAAKPRDVVTATIVRESATEFAVLWRLQPTAGWHLYADLSNDTGLRKPIGRKRFR